MRSNHAGKAESGKITRAGEKQLRNEIVDIAHNYIGAPYKYGGNSSSGFDCSGLTSRVMKQANIEIPRTSIAQSRNGKKIKPRNARAGDLLVFGKRGKVEHIGIVQDNKGSKLYLIHSTKSSGVRIDEVYSSNYWKSRLLWAVNVLESGS
jgi:cell wall-associated NlpC family hydrolase